MIKRRSSWFVGSSIAIFLCWALASFLLMSQGTTDSAETSGPAPEPIRFLIRTGAESEAIRQIISTFEEETGNKVELIELGREGYFTTLGTHLFSGTNQFDVVFVPSTYVSQFSAAGVIEPLNRFIDNRDLTDSATFDIGDFLTVYRTGKDIYALPTDISTHFLYYRSDLIPNPPQTWDELLETAKHFTQEHRPESPTKWGLAMTALAPEELPKVFDSLLWSFQGELIDGHGKVALDSPASIEAGRYMERLVRERVLSSNALSMGFPDVRDALLRGDAAMAAPYWNAAFSMILRDPEMKDKIKVALLPGVRTPDGNIHRSAFQHGWALAITANSKHPEKAWKLVDFITGKRGGRLYAQAGGTPARKSILTDPLLRITRPEFPLLLETMKQARNEPSVPYYPLMIDIENDALKRILTLQQPVDVAFREAAAKLRQIRP